MRPSTLLVVFFLPFVASDCPKNTVAGPGGKDCFVIGQLPKKWDEADTYCAAENGHLASRCVSADDLYGEWKWIDGSNFTYTNWDKAQPPSDPTGLCVTLTTTGKWITQPCTTASPFLCRIRPLHHRMLGGTTLPTTTPAYTCDVDNDEVYIPLTGKCYSASESGSYGWSLTLEQCRRTKGTLASIHSPELAIKLQRLMRFNQRNYTIGLYDPKGIGLWQWTDGTSMDYENWADGEPQPGKQCVAVFNKYGSCHWDPVWRAIDCHDESQAYSFICQYDAEKSR